MSIFVIISSLKTYAEPLENSNIPVSIDIVVVFPAPLCPNSTEIWFLYIVNDKFSTAYLPFE